MLGGQSSLHEVGAAPGELLQLVSPAGRRVRRLIHAKTLTGGNEVEEIRNSVRQYGGPNRVIDAIDTAPKVGRSTGRRLGVKEIVGVVVAAAAAAVTAILFVGQSPEPPTAIIDSSKTSGATIAVADQPPTAIIDAIALSEGTVAFAGRGTDPDGDKITDYAWTIEPGAQISSEASFSATFGPGAYTATLRVRANGQWSQPDTGSFRVADRPPTARIESITPNEDTATVAFAGRGTDPDGDAISAYAWTIEPGGHTSSEPSFSATFSPGTYTATLRVQANDVWSEPVTQAFSVVADQPPTAIIDTIAPSEAGDRFHASTLVGRWMRSPTTLSCLTAERFC